MRHHALRTCLVLKAQQLRQTFDAETTVKIEEYDLRKYCGESEHIELKKIRKLAQEEIIDAFLPPLYRVRVVHRGNGTTSIIWTLHHIAGDGASQEIFQTELRKMIAAKLEGRTPKLEPLYITYADYVCWMNDIARGPQREEHRNYWLGILNELPQRPGFVKGNQLPANRLWTTLALSIPSTAERAIADLALRLRTTTVVIHCAIFIECCHRLLETDDIIVSMLIAGRDRRELDHLIGNINS